MTANHAAAGYAGAGLDPQAGQHVPKRLKRFEPLFAGLLPINVAVQSGRHRAGYQPPISPKQANATSGRDVQLNPATYPLLEARADLLLRAQRYQTQSGPFRQVSHTSAVTIPGHLGIWLQKSAVARQYFLWRATGPGQNTSFARRRP